MPTIDELLEQAEKQVEQKASKYVCIIDVQKRTILIPEERILVGVESDEKAERVYFQCPKVVGDNIDLSTMGIRINYRNANKDVDSYPVSDVKVLGENIEFSWLLDRNVTKYKGKVVFIVCAVKTDDSGEITNEWNTTLAELNVIEGLEADVNDAPEEEQDIVKRLIAQSTQKLTEMSLALQKANEATSNANIATNNANNAADNANDAAQQVFDQQYILTTNHTFTDKAEITPTAYGNMLVKQLEGYTKQEKTNGYQLFDASKLPTKSQGGATVTNNGDGSFTISGSGDLTENYIIRFQIDDLDILRSLLKVGTLKSTVANKTNPKFYMYGSDGFEVLFSTKAGDVEITQDILDKTKYINWGFFGDVNTEINPGTIKPMLYQDGDGTWEPFTGGEPSPNPDYPQFIHGLGDMGYFDGELLQGSYNLSGNIVSDNSAICSVNKIPVKQGDTVEFEYEENNVSIYAVIFKNGVFIKNIKFTSKEIKIVDDANELCFYITKYTNSFPVSSAKHIAITINGKYAICVKNVGKNLIDFDSYYGAHGSNDSEYVVNNVTMNDIKIKIPKKLIGKQLTFSVYLKKVSTITTVYAQVNVSGKNKKGNIIYEDDLYKISKVSFVPETEIDFINITYGVGIGNVHLKNIQLEFGESATEYVPYQLNKTFIPIDKPLYVEESILKQNNEYYSRKNWGVALFDGGEDEVWSEVVSSTGNNVFFLSSGITDRIIEQGQKCNMLKAGVSGNVIGGKTVNSFVIERDSKKMYVCTSMTLDEFKQKITQVPLVVVYQLAEPTENSLTSEQLKVIYSIMSFDEKTYIEIVGVPSDVDVQNIFTVAINGNGALTTTAYATTKRNEVVIQEQNTLLQNRLMSLEQ